MKKLLITSALATILIAANVAASPQIEKSDLSQIFNGKNQNEKVAVLSNREMKKTKGAAYTMLRWVNQTTVKPFRRSPVPGLPYFFWR